MVGDDFITKGVFDDFEVPKPAVIFAGGFGGPAVTYLITPARNALTMAAGDSSASIASCYGSVFSRGLAGGWIGGIYPAIAGCPQFLLIGPAYHGFASFGGKWGGMVLTGITESMITYGAETKNAQLATIEKGGNIPANRVQNPLRPFGPGIAAHISRNVLALTGMRFMCEPITSALEKCTGTKGPAITLAGDFVSNIAAAGLTFPIHQLYNYTAITPAMWDKPAGERISLARNFLSQTYFVTAEDGSKRLSRVLMRDFGMRAMYIATGYTMYINFERACVKNWPS